MIKLGRNSLCPCGSGLKYKHCCLAKDEERDIEEKERAERKAGNVMGGYATIFNHAIERAYATARKIRKFRRRSK